ncbi:dual specificity catalytic domain containing protein [Stylonychia lemnae]|uniref:protein-tyrosine-phosphatase n=1 Tax=Stylonychia lemnae TaxID=5949 RepID=A0A078AXH4_STYLE|nr:dual specificity catalytic domain containing protein [Stylonychia lemnae]|eukprot:CDW85488.1 dual specificity catalytic domain containing protein [Stylonychia lemnae]
MQQNLALHHAYNEFQMIIPNLYLGGQISAMNVTKLQEQNIKRVLKVNGIESAFPFKNYGIELRVLDMDDMPDFDMIPFIDTATDYIYEAISNNQGCLVVCTAGISRSASIVISYLIKYKKMNYDQAFELTKKARVFVKPNPGFERQLKAYSVKMNCELCQLSKKTLWLDQYTQKTLGKKNFQVLICDQCDGPMIVYTAGHKQELAIEELMEAQAICQQVGLDFYGLDQWYIDHKQRTIDNHFHWHIRSTNDPMAKSTLLNQPKRDFSISKLETKDVDLDQIQLKSNELILEQIGGRVKEFTVLEDNKNFIVSWDDVSFDATFEIVSLLRLKKQNLYSFKQIVSQQGKIIFISFLRILQNEEESPKL